MRQLKVYKADFETFVEAYFYLEQLEAVAHREISELYEDVSPSIRAVVNGRLVSLFVPVEDMALEILEKRQKIERYIKMLQQKKRLFRQFYQSLTSEQRQLIYNALAIRPILCEFEAYLQRPYIAHAYSELLYRFYRNLDEPPEAEEAEAAQHAQEAPETMSAEEYDKHIDAVYECALLTNNNSELFEGYFDVDDTFDTIIRNERLAQAADKRGRPLFTAL